MKQLALIVGVFLICSFAIGQTNQDSLASASIVLKKQKEISKEMTPVFVPAKTTNSSSDQTFLKKEIVLAKREVIDSSIDNTSYFVMNASEKTRKFNLPTGLRQAHLNLKNKKVSDSIQTTIDH
ncbi:hypothetical protein [Candidatus Ulvibacter alkanivorans]|uniref:hypothetical protein n=1 Tax=Candidatus Ulvibacter alkanivorans TaxID=2267620 RepID=UPI00109CF7CD|nr:hypothetical protein [Candidatus Ulvibacter alkanivorans]